MEITTKPFYHKLSHSLIIVALVMVGLYLGQDILVPLALGGLLAILLRPVEKWLTNLGLPKPVAIGIALLLAIVVLTGLTILVSNQMAKFSDDIPKLKANVNNAYVEARRWVNQKYGISYHEQDKYVQKAQQQTLSNLEGTGAIGLFTGPIGTLTLLPIYIFLFLYYRTMLIHFVVVLFAKEHTEKVRNVLREIRFVVQSYMVGLLLETGAVAVLNIVGLLLLGIEYAVMLGIVGAILNLIPYIGGLIALVLTLLITFINHSDLNTLLGVTGIYLAVQFIDNNLLVPLIIGSKVRINSLVSIVGVLIGGAMAGASGMFLSIPGIAIMKVIFDRIPGLEPWGVLIGDETPEMPGSNMFRLKRLVWFEPRVEPIIEEGPVAPLAPPENLDKLAVVKPEEVPGDLPENPNPEPSA